MLVYSKFQERFTPQKKSTSHLGTEDITATPLQGFPQPPTPGMPKGWRGKTMGLTPGLGSEHAPEQRSIPSHPWQDGKKSFFSPKPRQLAHGSPIHQPASSGGLPPLHYQGAALEGSALPRKRDICVCVPPSLGRVSPRLSLSIPTEGGDHP